MRDGKMSGVSDTAVEPRSAVQIHRDSPLRRFSGLRAPQGSRETQNSHTKKKRTSKWLRIQARRMSLEKKGILKKKKRKSCDLGERGSTGTVSLSPNAEAWEGLLSSDQCPDSAGLQSVDDARECLAVSAGKRGMASPGGHWDCDSGVSFDVSPSVSGHSSPCPGINPAKLIAMDCEMVGTGLGGRCSEVARCSLVNYYGEVVYDKYIKPQQPVVDYRTRWSGISKCHLVNAVSFKKARREILQILKGKVVVGHALHNDFQALGFIPPKHLIRDTSSTHLLRQLSGFSGRGCISLKRLAKVLLQRDIQVGQKGHSSVEDAVAALDLYKQVEGPWEEEMMMRTQSPMENSPFMEPVFSPSHYMQDQYWPEEITKPCE